MTKNLTHYFLSCFRHQTGRLRIVRRIVPQPGQAPDGAPGANLNNNNAFINAGPQDTPSADTQPTTTTTTTNTTMASSSSGPNEGSSSSEASTQDPSSSGTIHQETDTLIREASSSSSNPSPLDNQQQDQPLPARVSPWRNIEHALLTFVTSLVPAPPPEIDPAVAAAAAGERM